MTSPIPPLNPFRTSSTPKPANIAAPIRCERLLKGSANPGMGTTEAIIHPNLLATPLHRTPSSLRCQLRSLGASAHADFCWLPLPISRTCQPFRHPRWTALCAICSNIMQMLLTDILEPDILTPDHVVLSLIPRPPILVPGFSNEHLRTQTR